MRTLIVCLFAAFFILSCSDDMEQGAGLNKGLLSPQSQSGDDVMFVDGVYDSNAIVIGEYPLVPSTTDSYDRWELVKNEHWEPDTTLYNSIICQDWPPDCDGDYFLYKIDMYSFTTPNIPNPAIVDSIEIQVWFRQLKPSPDPGFYEIYAQDDRENWGFLGLGSTDGPPIGYWHYRNHKSTINPLTNQAWNKETLKTLHVVTALFAGAYTVAGKQQIDLGGISIKVWWHM